MKNICLSDEGTFLNGRRSSKIVNTTAWKELVLILEICCKANDLILLTLFLSLQIIFSFSAILAFQNVKWKVPFIGN